MEAARRFETLGGHRVVWVTRHELRKYFMLVVLDSEGMSRRVAVDGFDQLYEGAVVEVKDKSGFIGLSDSSRFELFLYKPNDKRGPAAFACENVESIVGRVPEFYEGV